MVLYCISYHMHSIKSIDRFCNFCMASSISYCSFVEHGFIGFYRSYFYIQNDKRIQTTYRTICNYNKKNILSGYKHNIFSTRFRHTPNNRNLISAWNNINIVFGLNKKIQKRNIKNTI